MERCAIESCENTKINPLAWARKYYCVEHYNQMVWDEFILQYNDWKQDEPVHPEFKYILGRAYEEDFFKNIGDSYLSQARYRDRAFNYNKTEKGCCFEITRHLNSWEGKRKPKNIVEKWEIDIDQKTFVMVSKRNWRKKDPN